MKYINTTYLITKAKNEKAIKKINTLPDGREWLTDKQLDEILFEIQNFPGKSLHEAIGKKYKVPHTTIAVTLNRLHEKGLLIRKPQKTRGGTRYIYTPKLSREDYGTHLGEKFFSFLRKNFGENCVANLKKRL